MTSNAFDEYAEKYDGWFLKNMNVLQSELLLLKSFLSQPGRSLSVGCGSGLFELILKRDHGIEIGEGVEPSEGMASIARKRGMTVKPGVAESLPYADGEFDTVILNGTPSYISDLALAFREAYRVLGRGGRVVVADVPAESSYALLYGLAAARGTWSHPDFQGVAPECPYPVEFTLAAHWRTTPAKMALLAEAGFTEIETAQTLTRHPVYTNGSVEEPQPGFDRGDYVAIQGFKRVPGAIP